jgi:hypothetical protein
MVNRHFLTNYIENNQNLGETNINKKILTKVFDCKENEKFVKLSKKLSASTEWMATQVK